MGLDENEKVYTCLSLEAGSDDGYSSLECTFTDTAAKDNIESGESYDDYTYESDWSENGHDEWDEEFASYEDDDGNKYTDFQNIYYQCDFDTASTAGDDVNVDCGSPKVLKTSHSEDPDKLCFSNVLGHLVSLVIVLASF